MSKWLLVGVFACLLLMPAQASLAVPTGTATVLAQPAPPGPTIPPAPTVQDAADAKNRLVVGVVAVVLLGIVIVGRRARNKRQKDSGGS